MERSTSSERHSTGTSWTTPHSPHRRDRSRSPHLETLVAEDEPRIASKAAYLAALIVPTARAGRR